MDNGQTAFYNLFLENNLILSNQYRSYGRIVLRHTALIYTLNNQRAEIDALQQCIGNLRSGTSSFSFLRGQYVLITAALLLTGKNNSLTISEVLDVYNLLKTNGLPRSHSAAMAACLIGNLAQPAQYAAIAQHMAQIFMAMRKQHVMITNEENVLTAALFAIYQLPVQESITQIELLYQPLRRLIPSGHSAWLAAQILHLAGRTPADIATMQNIYTACSRRNIRLSGAIAGMSLCSLSLLPADAETLAQQMAQTYVTLREQKGFGIWSLSAQELATLCAACVGGEYINTMRNNPATVQSAEYTKLLFIIQNLAGMIFVMNANDAAIISASSFGN